MSPLRLPLSMDGTDILDRDGTPIALGSRRHEPQIEELVWRANQYGMLVRGCRIALDYLTTPGVPREFVLKAVEEALAVSNSPATDAIFDALKADLEGE